MCDHYLNQAVGHQNLRRQPHAPAQWGAHSQTTIRTSATINEVCFLPYGFHMRPSTASVLLHEQLLSRVLHLLESPTLVHVARSFSSTVCSAPLNKHTVVHLPGHCWGTELLRVKLLWLFAYMTSGGHQHSFFLVRFLEWNFWVTGCH